MSLFNNAIIGASGQQGYKISRSVRLRSSASAYLNRTFTTPTSNQKMTLSCWVKVGSTSQTAGQLTLLNGGNGTQVNASNSVIQLRTDGTGLKLQILCNGGGAATVGGYRTFAPYFRDNSAWYHIVLAADTTQATAANRYRGYINGVEITSYTGVDPNQNVNITWLNTAVDHLIGRNNEGGGPVYGDTYITEMYWIDGQQLTPSSFGETNAITGVWQPKKYAGTYGTNGFYLNFSDNSAATATTIGKDYSGNGNNWTPNNISITAGATYDSMLDVPTPYADGGNGRGNYCVMNPLKLQSNMRLTNGNLDVSSTDGGSAYCAFGSIMMSSGSWYAEYTINTSTGNYPQAGIGDLVISPTNSQGLGDANGTAYQRDGRVIVNNSTIGTFATFTNGDVIGVAYDATNNRIYFAKNNTYINSGNPSAGTGYFSPATPVLGYVFGTSTYSAGSCSINFGQRPFSYTPPTGFVALNTQNLPTPTISNGANYMAATLYTGTGASQTIANTVNGVSFQPDWVWVKSRSAATDHALYDAVRGVQLQLESNTTTAETTETTGLTAFGSTGFTVGALAQMNTNTATYVAWQWNAGGSTVTNTSGSISAQVRANPTAGFSVVTYSANGSTGTVGHGLGVAPSMIIVKKRNAVERWCVFHTSISNGYIYLNETFALETGNAQLRFGNNSTVVQPTSSVFSVGSSNDVNGTSGTYVAYCFAAVAGYSAFGSYTGNGSADGVFVYLGFRARFLMIKSTSTGGWVMLDTARDTYNDVDNYLYANSSAANAGSSNVLDINSNGFKIRNSWTDINGSGTTYIYMAFAENPFKLSLAR